MQVTKIFATSLLVLAVASSFAKERNGTRSAEGGGEKGYNKVNETTKEGWTTISCREPGYEKCPELFKLPADPRDNGLLTYAIAEIRSGNLSGSYTEEGRTVTWSSRDVSLNNSNIVFQTK